MKAPFINALIRHATSDERIMLITGDLGFNALEPFSERFPDRFLNVGVAEQSMVGIAAGLASAGYRPFIYSIANFPTFRAAEQIRNDVVYHGLDVVIVAVGGGVSYGSLGYSHHLIQDFSLMLSLPGMTILAPSDGLEAELCVDLAIAHGGPSYLRLDRAEADLDRPVRPRVIEKGGFVPLGGAGTGASETCVISTGGAATIAIPGTAIGAEATRVSMPAWGYGARDRLVDELRGFRHVITVESHLRGGFGTWVLEALAEEGWRGVLENVHLGTSVVGAVGASQDLAQQHMVRRTFRLLDR